MIRVIGTVNVSVWSPWATVKVTVPARLASVGDCDAVEPSGPLESLGPEVGPPGGVDWSPPGVLPPLGVLPVDDAGLAEDVGVGDALVEPGDVGVLLRDPDDDGDCPEFC